MGSCNACVGPLRFFCGEGIEIDELWIVLTRSLMEASAAMNLYEGLHTPGAQIVHMLVAQCDRQQHFWQPDQSERRNHAHLIALPPKQWIQRVDQFSLQLQRFGLRRLGWCAKRNVCVAGPRAYRRGPQLP